MKEKKRRMKFKRIKKERKRKETRVMNDHDK